MSGTLLGTPGPSVTPAPSKVALSTNYITDFSFIDQNLPDVYEKEFARYGNRSVAAMLRFTGSERPAKSDLIKWAENGRLHTQYRDVTTATADTTDTTVFTVGGGSCNFRVNQTVIVNDPTTGNTGKGIISAVTTNTFTVEWYLASGQPTGFFDSAALTVFVYGSEFAKGTSGMSGKLEAQSEFFDNKMIIIKDNYEVSGSDMAQITWLRGVTEDGEEGYYWFLKSKAETRIRFEDYLEMSMVEAIPAEDTSGAEAYLASTTGGGLAGTQGMFDAVEDGGNVWDGGYPETLAEYDDNLIDRLDKQGAISENMLFADRQFATAMDDMLGAINSPAGVSYGVFENEENMALSLGFQGFSRSGYEFYKTDWKYLNQYTLRGGITNGNVHGVLVPTGSTSIYDQMVGGREEVPFLHVRYRASEHTDRRYKSWITGGEAGTDDIDEMRVNMLSERALCTMGRNNFFIFKG